MDLFNQIVRTGIELLDTRHLRITDLNENCFKYILQYLSVYDLINCRAVNRYFLVHVDSYLYGLKALTYDSRLNGDAIRNGEYVFNATAFESILALMPNVKVLRFSECEPIWGALACTSHNIIKSLADHLIMLNELHMTRCRGITSAGYRLLVESFPNLTHLTTTLYNETSVEIIVKGLVNLAYLNLGQSCIKRYGHHFAHFGLKIKTFIAPPEYDNNKMSIIDGLINGYGIHLKRLELTVKIDDNDTTFFELIGKSFGELVEFKCEITSRRTSPDELILRGLSSLSNLRVLHVRETGLYNQTQSEHSWLSAIDDQSVLSILRNCNRLKRLLLITGKLNRNQSKSLTDASLSHINQLCPNLEELTLKSADISDKTLESIAKLGSLRELHLNSLRYVTNEALMCLMNNCVHVRRVDIIKCATNADHI